MNFLFKVFFILLLTVMPAQASDLLKSDHAKKNFQTIETENLPSIEASMDLCDFVTRYEAQDNVTGGADGGDLNPRTVIKAPTDFAFDLNLDLSERAGYAYLPSGIEFNAPIATVTYRDGHVFYNDQQLSSEDETALYGLCKIKQSNPDAKDPKIEVE